MSFRAEIIDPYDGDRDEGRRMSDLVERLDEFHARWTMRANDNALMLELRAEITRLREHRGGDAIDLREIFMDGFVCGADNVNPVVMRAEADGYFEARTDLASEGASPVGEEQ